MGKFEAKIKKMEDKLAYLQHYYGYNNRKLQILREKLELYKKVATLSYGEVGERLADVAGEIERSKYGFYYEAPVDQSKKLLNILRERIKSDKTESIKNSKREHGDLVEFGSSSENETTKGIEIS